MYLPMLKKKKNLLFFSNLIALPMGSMKTDGLFIPVLMTENVLKVGKLSTYLTPPEQTCVFLPSTCHEIELLAGWLT